MNNKSYDDGRNKHRPRLAQPKVASLWSRLAQSLFMIHCTLFIEVCLSLCVAQPSHTFTQYTSADGLNQRTVQYIIQDHKGLMWLATWDGLYRFDGYTFKNYKAYPGDGVALNSNRVERIAEDEYGYIYLRSYDSHLFRFDRNAEQFRPIPYTGDYEANDYRVLPGGEVWAILRTEGLMRVTTDPQTHQMSTDELFTACGCKPQLVSDILADSRGRRWLLTSNGVYLHEHDDAGERLVPYLIGDNPQAQQPIYAALEADSALFFSSVKGRLYRYDGQTFVRTDLPTRSSIKYLADLGDGRLLLGTTSDGFFVYNPSDGLYRHYTTANLPGLRDDCIREVRVDSRGEVWMRHLSPGVTHYIPATGRAKNFILQDKYGKDIVDSRMDMFLVEDRSGNLWVHPSGGGLGWYDREADRLVPFYNPALQSGWSRDNKVTVTFMDRQGNLWLCSYGNGLEKVTFNTSRFHLHAVSPDDPGFPGNNTRALFQDREGRIWTGGKDGIVRLYDSQWHYLGNLTSGGRIVPHSRDEVGTAYAITQDHRGTIWIGTKEGCGLISATPVAGPTPTYRLDYYCHEPAIPGSLSGNDVYSLHEDAAHRLWVATFDGGVSYADLDDPAGIRFYHAGNRLEHYPIETCRRTRFVTSDGQGRIWVGSAAGLLTCSGNFRQPEDAQFQLFTRIPQDAGSLSNNDVHGIHYTHSGQMYVTTFGGGLSRLDSLTDRGARFSSLTTRDGLPSDILLSIEEDGEGRLWMATEEELCKLNPQTLHVETYTSKAFPTHVIFNEGAALKTRDGRLMFNTRNGVISFHPDSVRANEFDPHIIFTDFRQEDERIQPKPGGLLTTGIDETPAIRLPHDRNSFSITFSALDFRYPASISYAYRLEGFEENWNYIGNQRTATYTNLPKGHYTLMVRSTNSDGIWTDNVRTMDFVILPSFWETPWARLLLVVIVVIVIMTASYILFTIFRLKHKVKVEQQIADIKLGFFTNISHELRTPLTLIAAPIEHIMQSKRLSHEEREQLQLVENNTNRMLRLVNQILDFRKMQKGKMRLRVQQLDLVPFVRHVMDNFTCMAEAHEIDFRLTSGLQSLLIWADADKLERILFNLLSNAFKYTPPGKQIEVIVASEAEQVSITVADEGIGISESKQSNLFVRFENLADRGLFNQQSTGIGLSLVKEMVEKHGGNITVQSRSGEGSRFKVCLLKGKDHFPADTEFILTDQAAATSDYETHDASATLTALAQDEVDDQINKERETLLIVEDNAEMRFFLKTVFTAYFNVLEAGDGLAGLEKAKRHLPDIILTDVMMPGMSGPAMTKALREELTTSHILIIWLTARADTESKVEGMELGADDYITKPFSATYLKARIFNLLERKKRLQALYCANLLSPEVGNGGDVTKSGSGRTAGDAMATNPLALNGVDPSSQPQQSTQATLSRRAFASALPADLATPITPSLSLSDQQTMDRVMAFIEANIDNNRLSVDDIANELHMSRSAFFRKLKALVGISPVEFLRSVRMKHAAELISSERYSMAQIAYMVGISDGHYFSKCFKQQFGITPTEYKENLRRTHA